jgi:hypothetical protein
MKCPNCRALIDDGVERCTFCGHYFKGSMMERYKGDAYDPTQGYKPEQVQPLAIEEPKRRFRLFKTKT